MSDIAIDPQGDASGTFNARTMLLVTTIGVLAFIAMLLLGAYAPDLRSGHNGGSHALSNAATGFSGLVRLADATGRNPQIVRVLADLDSESLAVITPDHGWTDVGPILDKRGSRATLIVLPKWETAPDRQTTGWVRVSGLLPAEDPGRMLAPASPLKISRAKGHAQPLRNVGLAASANVHFLAPAILQTMSGNGLEPMITTADGRVVLGRIAGHIYVLTDPDLLNNHGMADENQARAAVALLDFLNSTGADSVLFDVTANGLGRSRSPLKLAFDAPFLGVTLVIFAAMLLAAWQALVRFGPVRRPERAIAFGKAALVDNSAALIRKAGREAHLGGRYAEVIRERAIAMFRLPPTLDPQALSSRLESLNPHRSFAATAAAASNAVSRDELLSAAKSLNEWLKEAQQ
jgi:hypothetical protein